MNKNKENIRALIDKDEGLRSKRKMLTITSLILLAIQFSGAKVVEANTFILKLTFAHQNGISFLLCLAVFFLLLRYYNYAIPYHEKLYTLWTKRMLSERFFSSYDQYSDDRTGLIVDLKPSGLNFQEVEHDEHSDWSCDYHCGWFFSRYLIFDWYDEIPENSETINLFKRGGFLKYFKILGYELKHRIRGLFKHRENLDILAPYFIGAISLFSYLFDEKIYLLLNIFPQ